MKPLLVRWPSAGEPARSATAAGSRSHKGRTSVELRRFVITLDHSPSLSAKVGDARVDILTLDAGLTARLTAAAAAVLNDPFGTSAFTEGLVLGKASMHPRFAG